MAEARQYKAVMVGATGATGRYLLAELIKSKMFGEIVTLGRRKAEVPSEVQGVDVEEEEKAGRLKQQIVDMENLSMETVGEHLKEKDVFFTCLGTTRRQAGSANRFVEIDYGYNYKLAQIARECHVRLYSQMSTYGANKNSYFLYLSSKGKLENDCEELAFPQFSVFRPGFLQRGEERRLGEKIVGLFVNQISTHTVAKAMVVDAQQRLSSSLADAPEQVIYFNRDIHHMSDTADLNK